MMARLAYQVILAALILGGHHTTSAQEYRIGAGDLLSITVFDEPDLSLEKARVTTDGTISFPLLGQVSLTGLTAVEVEQKITTLLLDGYLKKPKVTVSLLQYRLMYVLGQVNKPGAYNYVEGLTVEKAIALAGGLTARGSDKKITLVREADPDIVEEVRKNTSVGPGDIIRVGEAFF